MGLMTQVGVEFVARNRATAAFSRMRGQIGSTERALVGFARSAAAAFGVGSGIYMAKNILQSSIREFASYERQLAKVSTMLDAQSMKYLPEYDQAIRKMATTYGEAAESLTSGTYDILSAQIGAADAMTVLETAVRSARGGFTTAAITTSATVQILKAYNLQAKETARIQDIMHATVQQGRFTFEQYASSIGDVIGLAAYLDIELEAMGASLAAMSKAGLSAETAVTALKNILNQFINPTEQAIQAAAELGFRLDETSVRGSGLIRIMDALKNANAAQLEALMPNLRGLVGFAGQLKNAGMVAEDYRKILEGAGLSERNFQKQTAITQTELDKTRESWKELQRILGEAVAPSLTEVLNDTNKALSEHSGAIKRYVEDYVEGVTIMSSVIKHYLSLKVPGLMIPEPEAPTEPRVTDVEAWRRYQEYQQKLSEAAEQEKSQAPMPPPVGTDGAMAMTVEQLRRAKEQVRDYLESVRHMDYLTRMERIENLEAYRRAHADIMYDTVGQETEANQLMQREIDALLRSRLDAMQVYQRELREDFESLDLYLSERFADVARDIERSGATLAKNMIRDWENWRDHVRGFFESVADAFADMAAQMIARWLMMKAMGMTGGGGGSPLGAGEAANPFGGFGAGEAHRGAIVGQDNLPIRYVSPKLFENAPRYHDLEPGDVAIIAQRGEEISRPGRTRTTQPPNVIINNNTGQPFTTDGPPSFDGERWVVSVVAQNIRQGGALKKIVRR